MLYRSLPKPVEWPPYLSFCLDKILISTSRHKNQPERDLSVYSHVVIHNIQTLCYKFSAEEELKKEILTIHLSWTYLNAYTLFYVKSSFCFVNVQFHFNHIHKNYLACVSLSFGQIPKDNRFFRQSCLFVAFLFCSVTGLSLSVSFHSNNIKRL